MAPIRTRFVLLVGTVAVFAAGATEVACSSKEGEGFTDGGTGGPRDATAPDAAPLSEAGGDGTPRDAGAVDQAAPDAAKLTGHCSPAQGPACDLVLQDCPASGGAPQECTPARTADGGITTACQPTTSSEHLGKGHACCPSATEKQCDPGLSCVGDVNASCDGGVPAGRCAPACCGGDAGDDFVCGSSDPEGYAGHCDVGIVDNGGNVLFNACSYDPVCKLFGLHACPAGYTCVVKDPSGTAGCSGIYVPDGGPAPTEGQTCFAMNGCADGLTCLTTADGGGSCFMWCLVPGSSPPFDAGALDGGPFRGGCSSGYTCVTPSPPQLGLPAWLSVCAR